MRKMTNNLRKSMVLGLVGGASLMAAPGGCGGAGQLFQTGFSIGQQLRETLDQTLASSESETSDSYDDWFYGF